MERIILTTCSDTALHSPATRIVLNGIPFFVLSFRYEHRDGALEFHAPTAHFVLSFLEPFKGRSNLIALRKTLCESCLEIHCDSEAVIRECGGTIERDELFG